RVDMQEGGGVACGAQEGRVLRYADRIARRDGAGRECAAFICGHGLGGAGPIGIDQVACTRRSSVEQVVVAKAAIVVQVVPCTAAATEGDRGSGATWHGVVHDHVVPQYQGAGGSSGAGGVENA